MNNYQRYCSKCGTKMEDEGRVQDYYDNYSPYLSYGITDLADGEPPDICQHIFTCPTCNNDDIVNITKTFK
ncbi:hypothetical protein [Oxobacter pfennigii]|uniref:hypothetical protein n=1 Tax=Oxobacter pfennigii TaxID=36849 RepID=UPI001364ACD0|nr:hypothetical protein [Oxobacter pfennigii]